MTQVDFAQSIARERTRARIAVGFLAAILVFELISIALYGERLVVLERVRGHEDVASWAESSDTRVGVWDIVTFLFQIPTALTLLMWLHTAYGNLRRVGTGYTKQTPGWAVGYWFIPVLNIFRPYQIVKELSIRSADGNARVDREGDPGPTSVTLWWTAYFVSIFVIRGAQSAASRDPSVQQLIGATWTLIAGTAIRVLAAGLLISVVRFVDRRQAAFRPSEVPRQPDALPPVPPPAFEPPPPPSSAQ